MESNSTTGYKDELGRNNNNDFKKTEIKDKI